MFDSFRVKKREKLTESERKPSLTFTWAVWRTEFALNLRIEKIVDANEKDAKITAITTAILAISSRPGKERNVTDALNTIAALRGIGAVEKSKLILRTSKHSQNSNTYDQASARPNDK